MSMYDFITRTACDVFDVTRKEHKITNEKIEQLEKRIESLEAKLDSILTLLKERQEIKVHIPVSKIQKLIK